MKVATFNMENIFQRHMRLIKKFRESRLADWEEELNALMRKEQKSVGDTERIEELLEFLGFNKQKSAPCFELKRFASSFGIRMNHSRYLPKASLLTDWEGWMQLASQPISQQAILHKAQVISDVDPDILFLQEVEDRNALVEFNKVFLQKEFELDYKEVYFSPTNDAYDRGMGILLKPGYRVNSIKTHVNERDDLGVLLFDFDVLEVVVTKPCGSQFLFLHAHFTCSENTTIKAQAIYLANLYSKRSAVFEKVVVLGCLQLPSFSKELSPVFKQTKLKLVSRHTEFSVMPDLGIDASYHRLGGYRKGVNIKQQDYILLPPNLYSKVQACGLNRLAMWPEKRPQWKLYPTVKKQSQAASGHPVLWVGLE
jgi:hypothetical protein